MSRRYGWPHDKAAKKLKAAMRDGHPCARCGLPMYRWQLALDRYDPAGIEADHVTQARVFAPGGLPDALSHRRCNRRAGAQLARQLHPGLPPFRRRRPAPPDW